MYFRYRVFSIKRPGVYFKLGLVDPAFIWSRRLIGARRLLTDCNFLSNFQIDLLLPISETKGQFVKAGQIFLFVLPRCTASILAMYRSDFSFDRFLKFPKQHTVLVCYSADIQKNFTC